MDSHNTKVNRDMVVGWLVVVLVLAVAYAGEVIKGERALSYFISFMLATAVPAMGAVCLYCIKKDLYWLKYYIVTGYFVMYLYTMVTGNTDLVFTYVLPMLAMLVLYHQPRLILVTGIASVIVNLVVIIYKSYSGLYNVSNSKDAEIQIALIVLCFAGSYVATRLYDEITKQNEHFFQELQLKNSELDRKNEQIQSMTLQTITTIANTIDAKDEYTKGHSKRVSDYSVAIATEIKDIMHYTQQDIENIRAIALLHDIGKIGVPDSVLNKPGKLTDDEFAMMKNHTIIGADILKDIGILPGIELGAKYHHERYDGKGYPDQLAGEDIPFISRIIAVADAYDAMTSNRVYRRPLSDEKVLSELENGVGRQFDPMAARAMIRMITENRLSKIMTEDELQHAGSDVTSVLKNVVETRNEQITEGLKHDNLTGVYNKEYGEKIIKQELDNSQGCLVVFDVDEFRAFNNTHGFMLGDYYLKRLSGTLKKLDGNSIIFRSGGDEFVAYFKGCDSDEKIDALMLKFYRGLALIKKDDKDINDFSVSMGVSLTTDSGRQYDSLLQNADKALYFAKQQGGGQYSIYHKSSNGQSNGFEVSRIELNKFIRIIRDSNAYTGAFNVAYKEFGKIFEYVQNMAERNNQNVQIVLFTLIPKDESSFSVENMSEVMKYLEKAVTYSIRNVDVTSQYSSSQRIVALVNLDRKQINTVTDRILKEFYKMYTRADVNITYDIANLSDDIETEE
ncbi:MAG: HD domain-containing phosphohydrolase [Lachnospira sp.]